MPIGSLGEKSTPSAVCKRALGAEEHRAAPPLSVHPSLPSPLPSPPLTPLLSGVQASEITEEANSPRPREMLDPLVITAWRGRRSTQVAGIRPANRAELYPSAKPSWLCLLLPHSPESQWSSGKQEQRLGFSLPGGSKEAGDG